MYLYGISYFSNKLMSKSSSNAKGAVEAVRQLVNTLAPLNAGERQRAISAATILLGDPPGPAAPFGDPIDPPASPVDGISQKASGWMRKNGLSPELLDHVFSIDGGNIDVIATKMPGRSKRQQTVESYLICGLRAYLQTGEVSFVDKDARSLCQKVGCYDPPNHSNYMKALGNRITGSKDAGWRLTNPGLSEAAHIVKQLTEPTHSQ